MVNLSGDEADDLEVAGRPSTWYPAIVGLIPFGGKQRDRGRKVVSPQARGALRG
jgi:hypothetical protein